jgi:predicted SAM-dependent methyltransferase
MTLTNPEQDHKGLYVNVASGHYVLEGFVNLDFNRYLILSTLPVFLLRIFLGKQRLQIIKDYNTAKKQARIQIHNCRKPLPFKYNSVDHILCSHFIEHVTKAKARKILLDFYNVLKPSGTLHMIVPDLEWRTKAYLKNTGDPEAADRFLESMVLVREEEPGIIIRFLEFIGTYGAKHRWMYDNHSLVQLLRETGFRIEKDNNTPSSQFRLDDEGQVNLLFRK